MDAGWFELIIGSLIAVGVGSVVGVIWSDWLMSCELRVVKISGVVLGCALAAAWILTGYYLGYVWTCVLTGLTLAYVVPMVVLYCSQRLRPTIQETPMAERVKEYGIWNFSLIDRDKKGYLTTEDLNWWAHHRRIEEEDLPVHRYLLDNIRTIGHYHESEVCDVDLTLLDRSPARTARVIQTGGLKMVKSQWVISYQDLYTYPKRVKRSGKALGKEKLD